jgi:predicted regulator of Ras-like GTPase activity (Roadblock/LC7/MglB family)
VEAAFPTEAVAEPATAEPVEPEAAPTWEFEEEALEEPVEAELLEPEPAPAWEPELVAAEPAVEDETAEPRVPTEAVEIPTEPEPVEVAEEARVLTAEPMESVPEEPAAVEREPETVTEPGLGAVTEAAVEEARVEAAPVAAAAPDEAMGAVRAAADQLGAPQTDWAELSDGSYLASVLPGGAAIRRAREAATAVLAAGRELCDASERGALSTVLATAQMGSAALGWTVTPGGARIACQLSATGTRSPGKVGAAAHKLMRALRSMGLTGEEPSPARPAVSEEWVPFDGDDNGAEEAERAARAVKLAGLTSQLFVRGDGPRMILLGPQGLVADWCVSAAGALLDAVADYATSIGLGEVEKVIVEGDAGAAALVPAQNGKPALVLLAPGSTKAGMVSVQIGKAAAALGA